MLLKHVPLIDAVNDLSYKCVHSKNPDTFEKLGQVS